MVHMYSIVGKIISRAGKEKIDNFIYWHNYLTN